MHPSLTIMFMDAQRAERHRQARAFRVNAARNRSRQARSRGRRF